MAEVIEIRAPLPAESSHTDVRHGTRLEVSFCCYGAGTTRFRCGVRDARIRGHVCTCFSRCRAAPMVFPTATVPISRLRQVPTGQTDR